MTRVIMHTCVLNLIKHDIKIKSFVFFYTIIH